MPIQEQRQNITSVNILTKFMGRGKVRPLIDKFEENIFCSPDGCWYWLGSITKEGYGQISAPRSRLAHRISYQLFRGDPGKLLVCHSCDNRLCVNPNHLFLGTHMDNTHDMINKGRQSFPKALTHCRRGHEFTPENTYLVKYGKMCKTCHKWKQKQRWEQRKKEKLATKNYHDCKY